MALASASCFAILTASSFIYLALLPAAQSIECTFPLHDDAASVAPPFQDAQYLGLATRRPVAKVQSVYTATDLAAAGLRSGDIITGIELRIDKPNDESLPQFRVALRQLDSFPTLTRWGTLHTTFATPLSEVAGDVVYGPKTIPTATLTAGEYFTFALPPASQQRSYAGASTLILIEFSHDTGGTTSTLDQGAPRVKYPNTTGAKRTAFAYTYYCADRANWCSWGGFPFVQAASATCCPSQDASKSISASSANYVLDVALTISRDYSCNSGIAPVPAPEPSPEPAPAPAPGDTTLLVVAVVLAVILILLVAVLVVVVVVRKRRRGQARMEQQGGASAGGGVEVSGASNHI